MKPRTMKRTLITIGLLTVLGGVAAATQEAAGNGPAQQPPKVAGQGTDTMGPQRGWNPWEQMRRMEQRMDRMFEQDWRTMESAMSGMRGSSDRRSDESNLTLQEEKGDYRVTADLPGVKEGDLDVSLDGRLLRISAQRGSTNEATADNGEVVRREAYSSGMQWAFTLPGPVDVSKMHTDLSDGVLTVTIPKAKS